MKTLKSNCGRINDLSVAAYYATNYNHRNLIQYITKDYRKGSYNNKSIPFIYRNRCYDKYPLKSYISSETNSLHLSMFYTPSLYEIASEDYYAAVADDNCNGLLRNMHIKSSTLNSDTKQKSIAIQILKRIIKYVKCKH